MTEGLGDRCKQYEMAEAGKRALRGTPLIARLDGRAFHTFTRDLRRPYDEAMSRCMIETTRYLVRHMNALVGYTQSDEISLAWYEPSQSVSEYPFDGRLQKLTSVLAGMASVCFLTQLMERLPGKAAELPHFDCRVWQVPTLADAADVFLWREDDATKNSITMAARAVYSDRELHEKDSSVKQEMLFQKGINWNDYPAFFKRGSYLQRRTVMKSLMEDERAKIPERHRPAPDALFERTEVLEIDLPPARKIGNLLGVLFERAEPIDR